MSDIIVNTADESITDLANAVVVRDWHQGDLTDEDTVLYAEAHGKRLADLVELVRAVANFSTSEEVLAGLDDPDDPDQVLEAEQGMKQDSVDSIDSLVGWARKLI